MTAWSVIAMNDQNESTDYIQGISEQQLLDLHVAANYKLRRSHLGWRAVGYECPDKYPRIHSPFAIRSLLKRGLLEGNARGEKAGLRYWRHASTGNCLLWISAKGRTLLSKIAIETGLVFDEVNYQLIRPGEKVETDGIDLGNCYSERKPTAVYDRAIGLVNEDEAENISS
jgi:hypothetical protein